MTQGPSRLQLALLRAFFIVVFVAFITLLWSHYGRTAPVLSGIATVFAVTAIISLTALVLRSREAHERALVERRSSLLGDRIDLAFFVSAVAFAITYFLAGR